ncbi:MAG: protease SohB [Gammaproteobacteria bacterium]
MSDFLFEYGLFATKALTIVLGILITLAFFVAIVLSRKKEKEESYLEIENINDKFEDLQDNLESEILSKSDYKKLQKLRKKEKKQEEKAKKKSNKQDNVKLLEEERPRVFVLRFCGDLTASPVENLREEITAILMVAKETDEVLILLESGGGIVHNYGLAAAQLQRIKEKNIKLVASVDLIAASGGYMMACVANTIIAAPFAIVGSIGVLAQLPNFNKLLQKHNIDIEHHTSGEYKSTLTMLGKNTDKGRDKFIAELEDTHKLFKEFVKNNRSQVDLKKISTGEYWYGLQAMDLNLIDGIKTSDNYLIEKCKDHDVFSVEYKIHESLKEKLSNILSKSVQHVLSKLTCKTALM